MRDDFPMAVKDILAKRVGYLCSNPECHQLTSGPQVDPTRAVNIGVAAHITAASPGGSRFDPTLTSEQRCSAKNGIWLCQNHGKLVDNDEKRYSVALLREWKRSAESMAELQLQKPRSVSDDQDCAVLGKAERLMPELLAEMRADLAKHPLSREFVVLKKAWVYCGKGNELSYYYDDHPELNNKLQIMKNLRLVQEITYNNTKRFLITEALAEYLGNSGESS